MNEITLLKIGGSVITKKERTDYTVRTNLLREITRSLKAALDQQKQKLVLIHGAGGHIHYLAQKYGLRESCLGNSDRIRGALHTSAVAAKLNADVVTIAMSVGLELVPISPHSYIQTDNGSIVQFDIKNIQDILTQNKVPVLYGDMTPDYSREYSICSGDKIAAYLTERLPIIHLLFASDIDGVYTKDPHRNTDAVLLKHISLTDMSDIELSGSHEHDTTDGLRGKIHESKYLFNKAHMLESITVFNGYTPEHFKKVLVGENFTCTHITK